MLLWIQGKTRKDRIRNEKSRSDAMVKPITTYVAQKRLSWYGHDYCDKERRQERCKASNNNEGGREETSRKAQIEVDGQSAERSETTPARPRTRTEPSSMEKGQSWRSTPDRDKIGKGEQVSISRSNRKVSIYVAPLFAHMSRP